MDNLQKHYLVMLSSATRTLLDGDIEGCLNICFELRLKPDIALYTRALVNLTICDTVHFEECSEKLEIAVDAMRIAKNLQEEEHPQKDAFWTSEYNRLVTDASNAVEQARKEEQEYLYALVVQEARLANDSVMENLAGLTIGEETGSEHKDEEKSSDEWDSDDEALGIHEWTVEGAFTLDLAPMTSGSSGEPEDEDDPGAESDSAETVIVEVKTTGGLVTPPSSQPVPEGDENDESM